MEILKFKIGDKVRVKSLEWYNENKDANGLVYLDKQGIVFAFDKTMANLCGKIVQIEEVNGIGYLICGYSGFLQDWMLEDEAVIEEKQEVKQLNNSNMETKEMTKEEIFVYLGSTKILCTSTEESINVQKKLFELGFEWNIPGKTIDELKFLLYIEGKLLKYVLDIDFWVRSLNYTRIEPKEILSIKLKEDKPKFDPKVLLPFDEVLARNKSNRWYARFFDFYEEGIYYTASGEIWDICIPYNDETKHLHGTAEEAPEFYRI